MKNIHVLPTDKPSKFFKDNVRHAYYFYYDDVKFKSNLAYTAQNIYITSDEEIKQKELCYCISNNCIVRFSNFGDNQKNYKKIILTTDQDLIKDGVQAIDDEFLEWFVKNPSCDSVGIEKYHGINTSIAEVNAISGDGSLNWQDKSDLRDYKIIIPKEKTKQLNVRELNRLDDIEIEEMSNDWETMSKQREPKQETLLEDIFNDEKRQGVKELIDKHKQETLEEAKLRQLFKNRSNCYADSDDVVQAMDENCFIETIKEWQQKRSYSEEDMKDYALKCVGTYLFNGDFIADNLRWRIVENNNKQFEKFKKQIK